MLTICIYIYIDILDTYIYLIKIQNEIVQIDVIFHIQYIMINIRNISYSIPIQ